MEEILIGILVVSMVALLLWLICIVYISKQWKRKERKNPCLECSKDYSYCNYCKHFYKYGGKLRWS